MPDANDQNPGQAPTNQDDQMSPETQTDDQTTQTTPDGDGQEPDASKTFDAEYVKKLRAEAAANRKKASQLEAELKKHQDAQLSEIEKAKKAAAETAARLEATEAALRAERVGREVERAAVKLNLDPELAGRLVSADMLEFDDETGMPTNTEKVLQGLLKKWPNLVKGQVQPANINANDGRGTALPDPKAREAELRKRFRI